MRGRLSVISCSATLSQKAALQLPFSATTPLVKKGVRESPRLRSNKSPSEAFKRQSGLRKQMEGFCPDKLRRLS